MVRNVLLGMGLATVFGVSVSSDILSSLMASVAYLVLLAAYCLSAYVTGDVLNDRAKPKDLGDVLANFVVLVGASVLAQVVGAEYVGGLIAIGLFLALVNGKLNASVSGSAGGSVG